MAFILGSQDSHGRSAFRASCLLMRQAGESKSTFSMSGIVRNTSHPLAVALDATGSMGMGLKSKVRRKDEGISTQTNKTKKKKKVHKLWQHAILLPLCPSVVGGTLMSTTLLPGESSCADLSDICFWDTMR